MRNVRALTLAATATATATLLIAACATQPSTGPMGFFITSTSPGNGGNLGGLAGADAQLLSAQAKLVSTRLAERQLPVLAQAMGAEGLRREHCFGRHLAGARVASFVDGSNEMLLERIAALQRHATG